MPLQIRRGTDAERSAMTQPLAAGELIYVTDTQRLFVGNGATVGGVGITGYTDSDAKDAAATLFTNDATHTGISFSYNGTTNEISASVDLSAFEGLIEADLKGSVFADDSTLLVDAVSGRIVGPVFSNVTGNVVGNVTGNSEGYHTGDVNGSVFADDSTLLVDAVSGRIVGPVFSNVTGNVVGNVTGNVVGNVTGNSEGYHTGDVNGSVFADDSTLLVDAVSGRIVGPVFSNVTGNVVGNVTGNVVGNVTGNVVGNVTGNSEGYHTGDVNGSVFADDSTLLVDGINSSLHTSSLTIEGNTFTSLSNDIIFGSTTDKMSIRIWQDDINFPFLVAGGVIDSGDSPWFSTEISRGTNLSPAIVQQNDLLSGTLFKGFDGSTFVRAATIAAQVDDVVVADSSMVPGKLLFVVQSSLAGAVANDSLFLTFNSKGTLSAPVIQTGLYATIDLPAAPAFGMIVYNTTTNKFQGYQNTSGTTPEWVDLS
jgi:outer membrane lipoprotein SlyB